MPDSGATSTSSVDRAYHRPIPVRVTKAGLQRDTLAFVRKQRLEAGFAIEPLVNRLGGRIKYGELYGPSQSSESLRVHGIEDFTIYVATNTSPVRDRFTIARELAHYLLHYPMVLDAHGEDSGMFATRSVKRHETDQVRADWESTWFANALLMPEPDFKEQWDVAERNLYRLASYFAVPKSAVEVRANSLKLAAA
ncbi:ImmA/IrrE family metallo-endopeptidase [Nisaea acidiphila]|uniref:ImmA/IrrE family metallo-endopeptidase n=1 Tax=Nisaea acidiphila TaxID=1862145 RepID=A0A9J7AS44_9PROT|nr:ImmA/IrrE family metallo-endopeptidase [Nisaea acidiphila]UUX50451.1 ImmA/IrrE family metallo-endopeptidase [Nisaea acidiphila]